VHPFDGINLVVTSMLFETPVWLWLVFGGVVLALLAFDLGVLRRTDRAISVKQSLCLSAGYIGVALVFAAWLSWQLGLESGVAFLTGYAMEKTLALDNIFLISTVFALLAVPAQYQHRVLLWGILGAIVLRAILIALGVALIAEFHWVLYVFGVFLVLTGIRMFVRREGSNRATHSALSWLRRRLRITEGFQGGRFWITAPAVGQHPDSRKVLWATPLLLALVLIELLDLAFAVDSVPAVFAITQDPFIVYTSNIFAILGLRALYFSLAALVERFHYLHYALAAVLVFIGAKILAEGWVGKMPVWASLLITVGLLAAGVLYSLYRPRGGARRRRFPTYGTARMMGRTAELPGKRRAT
jgi:tellurite resistance protein TerC